MPITPQRIVIKHSYESGAIPDINDLVAGELALNATDNVIFYRGPNDQLVSKDLDFQSSIVNYVNDTFSGNMIQDAVVDINGDLLITYLDNSFDNLGNVIGPRGEGIAINGVVDYAIYLPLPVADGGGVGGIGLLPESLNKTGTIFVVRLGIDENNLFGTSPYDPGDPVLYMYNAAEPDPALRWFSTGVLQGPQGETGPAGPAGPIGPSGNSTITNSTVSDGTANLNISSLTLNSSFPLTFATSQSFAGFKNALGLLVGERNPVFNLNLPYDNTVGTIFPVNTGTSWEMISYSFDGGIIPDGVTDVTFDAIVYNINNNTFSWRFPTSLVNLNVVNSTNPYDDFYNIIGDLISNPNWGLTTNQLKVADFSLSAAMPDSFFPSDLQSSIDSLISNNWVIRTNNNNLPGTPWVEITSVGISNKVDLSNIAFTLFVTKGDDIDLPGDGFYGCHTSSNDPVDWFTIATNVSVAWPLRESPAVNLGVLYYTYLQSSGTFYFTYPL